MRGIIEAAERFWARSAALASLRRFLGSTAGAVALGGAVLSLPIVGLSTAAVQVTMYSSIQTRLHQSQCAASLAVAKEGEAADGQAIIEAWMPTNLESLGRPDDQVVHEHVITETGARINSVYLAKPLAAGLMDGIFEKAPLGERAVASERFYRPLEVVVVVDGSSSTRTYVEQYKATMKRLVRTFLRGRDKADDVRISLVAFSGHMNIGRRYADKLITPESRRLYDDGTATYERRRATLTEYNASLPGDLLAEGGPGSVFGMACVGRRDLSKTASAGEIAAYVEAIERPPDTPSKGFNLLMGDDRPVTEAGTSFTSYGQPFQVVNTFITNNVTKIDPPYGILDYVLAPKSAVTGDTHDLPNVKLWTLGDLKPNGTPNTWAADSLLNLSSVGIYYNCSSMPMLVGSSELDELDQNIGLYSAGWTTGGDEGLAWALRALSPAWSEVWERGEDFPAPYESETQKMIFFLGDTYNNTGYPSGITGTGPNALAGIIETIVDHGIELYLFIDGSMWNSSTNKFYSIVDQFVPKENVFYAGTSAATVVQSLQKMEEMAVRTFDVRLAEGSI